MEKFSGWRISLLSPGHVADWLDSSTEDEKSLLSFLGTVGYNLYFLGFNTLLGHLYDFDA